MKREGIKVNRKVRVFVQEKTNWSDIWGTFKSDIPTEELIRRVRTERD